VSDTENRISMIPVTRAEADAWVRDYGDCFLGTASDPPLPVADVKAAALPGVIAMLSAGGLPAYPCPGTTAVAQLIVSLVQRAEAAERWIPNPDPPSDAERMFDKPAESNND
jgi:hypothetical protein